MGVPQLASAEAAGWASAVGTFAAVVVALVLAQAEGRRRRRDAVDQSRGMSVLLLTGLIDWQHKIRQLAHHVKLKRRMAITESFDVEGGDILRIPPMLEARLEKLHVLGSAAVPLSRAVMGAAAAKRMEWAVRDAVKNYTGDNVEVMDVFQSTLEKAAADLLVAINLIGGALQAEDS
jgi:hypothetical protein